MHQLRVSSSFHWICPFLPYPVVLLFATTKLATVPPLPHAPVSLIYLWFLASSGPRNFVYEWHASEIYKTREPQISTGTTTELGCSLDAYGVNRIGIDFFFALISSSDSTRKPARSHFAYDGGDDNKWPSHCRTVWHLQLCPARRR